MSIPEHHQRGGGTVANLKDLDRWEATLVMNLRLWCEGPSGKSAVCRHYAQSMESKDASLEVAAFETLLNTIVAFAHRPMVRHGVECTCVGSDECIFVNLVRTASEGHINDAALISTLLTGPAQAERIALLAGQVGTCVRRLHETSPKIPTRTGSNVIRFH